MGNGVDWPAREGPIAGSEYTQYAAVYDALFADLSDDAEFYLACARTFAGDRPILELGTGTGRLAERLLRAGHAVTGVDVSEAMLARARTKLAPYGEGYRAILADARTLDLGERFHLAVIPFGTVAHFLTDQDRLRAFRSVFEHLEPGGVFVFDDLPSWLCGASDGTRLEVRRTGFDVERKRAVRLLSNAMDVAGEPYTVRYDIIDWLADGGVEERIIVRVVFRNIELARELSLLREAGFGEIEVLGHFDGRAFDRADLSSNARVIVRCRRPS